MVAVNMTNLEDKTIDGQKVSVGYVSMDDLNEFYAQPEMAHAVGYWNSQTPEQKQARVGWVIKVDGWPWHPLKTREDAWDAYPEVVAFLEESNANWGWDEKMLEKIRKEHDKSGLSGYVLHLLFLLLGEEMFEWGYSPERLHQIVDDISPPDDESDHTCVAEGCCE